MWELIEEDDLVWELVHEFVETLVWPTLLVIVLVFFRNEIKALVQRLSKLSVGDITLELQEKVQSLETQAESMANQRATDSQAILMVDVQLSQTLKPSFEEDELIKSVKAASERTLNTIYMHAKDVRKKAWHSMQSRRKQRDIELSLGWMERTIPIFRALTETKHGGKWHRYYAQLGYAQKDTGHINEARTTLDMAIELWKQESGRPVSPHYRFNWVFCEVRIDNKRHEEGAASEPATKAAVKEALEEASSFLPLAKAIKADPEIESWLDRNGLDWKYLALP